MLVQKKGITKSTKNLLIILGSIIVLGGLYFGWDYLSTNSSSSESDSLLSNTTVVPKNIQTNLDTELFDNPQFQGLDRDQFEGFVDQAEGIALSDKTPTALQEVTVKDPETGSTLIVFWKLPEYINFDRIVVYRSVVPGQIGEQITSVDVDRSDVNKIGSYLDQDLTNGARYYYLVDPKIGPATEGEASSVSGVQIMASPSDLVAPASPENIQVRSLNDEQMQISWTNPDDEDLAGINIYRSTEKGSLGLVIVQIKKDDFSAYIDDAGNMKYVDDDISSNIVYYYTVTSLDKDGNESTTDVLAAPYKSYFYNPFEPIDF